MIFQSPGDVIINIFGFPVYYYGVILALACVVGVLVSFHIFKKYNPDKDYNVIWDFASYIIIFGILGARLYYCLLNASYYMNNPIEIFYIRQGGLSIHGGVTCGVLTLVYLAKKHNLPIWSLLDSFACGTAIAQTIGRWGNFFNSEAFGVPTDLPWKLFIPTTKRPLELIDYNYFHPAFLYESILDFIVFVILILMIKKTHKKQPGIVFSSYLIFYSIIRIFTEYIRVDSALNISEIPIAQIISVLWIFFGLIILVSLWQKNKIT